MEAPCTNTRIRARRNYRDWGTLVFNYDRHEVRTFLISSACSWLEDFHIDGLRVDAVASMLYLDYSRKGEDWVPNREGGNQNLEAIEFIRELNSVTHLEFPGTVTLAEESTDWPMVSRPASSGGLGFSMKWNMGWMHDTLEYMSHDPVHRSHHHQQLTFGMMYAYSENFVLPFSHDEVVHLKHSLLGRMPGDEWQRFANLRLSMRTNGPIPGRSCSSWAESLPNRRSGTFAWPCPGIWPGTRLALACVAWSAILIGCIGSTRRCHVLNSSRAASAGSIARIELTPC